MGRSLVLNLDRRLPTLLNDLERPVLDVVLDFRLVHLATDETLSIEHGGFWVGVEGVLCRVTNSANEILYQNAKHGEFWRSRSLPMFIVSERDP